MVTITILREAESGDVFAYTRTNQETDAAYDSANQAGFKLLDSKEEWSNQRTAEFFDELGDQEDHGSDCQYDGENNPDWR